LQKALHRPIMQRLSTEKYGSTLKIVGLHTVIVLNSTCTVYGKLCTFR